MTESPICLEVDDELLSPADPNLICPICLKLLSHPSRTPCGHIFCTSCLQEWLPQKAQCPECRSPVCSKDVSTDRFAERLVANLQGFCQFRKKGCQWVGSRGDMNSHLSRDCQCVTVSCPNKGCSKEVLRRDLWKHTENDCQATRVQKECPFGCGHECPMSELERHKEQCLMEPRKLMAALKHLHLENQRLAAENTNLRDLTNLRNTTEANPPPTPTAPLTQPRSRKRREGPGACID